MIVHDDLSITPEVTDDAWIKALFDMPMTADEQTAYATWERDWTARDAVLQADHAAREAARIAAVERERAERRAQQCPKCGGMGRLTQYMHRNNGVCYKCGGTGRR